MNETEQLNHSNNILYVDVGNSLIKLKIFTENGWNNIYQITHNDLKVLADYFGEHAARYESIVLSSVVDDITSKLKTIFEPLPVTSLKTNQIPDKLLNYETPETLGIDRFLACYGAYQKSGTAVVVIDAGTACTIDFMDESGIFQGGVIMPGLHIMEDGLKRFAPALPAVERSIPDKWPGKSTKTSLQWGISGVYLDALNVLLNRYETQFGSYDLWLTGGDVTFLTRHLGMKGKIDQNLVFDGMREFVKTSGF